MKIRVTPLRLSLLFGVIILMTRSTQYAFAPSLPDATIALMLLGGMWIRRWPGFAALMGAAFAADWFATSALGVSDYCVTPAYAGLVPAYLAAWLCGWGLQAARLQGSLPAWVAATVVATAASFAISNAFWYEFSGNFAGWTAARLAADVSRYYPAYLVNALGYVALAWLARLAARHLGRSRSLGSAS